MKRGDVYAVNFDPQLGSEIAKRRPAVVMGNDLINEHRRTVLVLPLTTAHTQTAWPVLVAVRFGGVAGCACVDQLKAADRRRLGARLGALTADEMHGLDEALRFILAL